MGTFSVEPGFHEFILRAKAGNRPKHRLFESLRCDLGTGSVALS